VQTLKHHFLEHRGLLLGIASRVELHDLQHAKLRSLDLAELLLELCDLENHKVMRLTAHDLFCNEFGIFAMTSSSRCERILNVSL
jgi:hypothetical protein